METSKMLTLTVIDFRKSSVKVRSQSTRPIVTNSPYWTVWSFCKRYSSMLFDGSHRFSCLTLACVILNTSSTLTHSFIVCFNCVFLHLIVGLCNTVHELQSGPNLTLFWRDSPTQGWGPVSCLQRMKYRV